MTTKQVLIQEVFKKYMMHELYVRMGFMRPIHSSREPREPTDDRVHFSRLLKIGDIERSGRRDFMISAHRYVDLLTYNCVAPANCAELCFTGDGFSSNVF